jgi:hypothetical protein
MGMESQFGQAEWILEFFCSQGYTTGTVFEAGAHSPFSISNASCFIRSGWKAILVESQTEYAEAWSDLKLPDVAIHNATISYGARSLDRLFSQLNAPLSLDIMFLDIDGGEYHLLRDMVDYRPKVICVEYDNSYPLSIDYVPKSAYHGVRSGQASSRAMYRLMQEKGYIYINSFFLDHVFIDSSFLSTLKHPFTESAIGLSGFITNAPRHLYDVNSVLINQEEPHGDRGIIFYRDKLENLINCGMLRDAHHYYCHLSVVMKTLLGIVKSARSTDYFTKYSQAVDRFDESFRGLLFYS